MGRKLHYRPGSFYRVSDRTGFKVRAEDTIKEWNGQIVERRVFEPRHPQDLVRGVRDHQGVPDPRPDSPDVFVGPVYDTLAAYARAGSYAVKLTTPELLQIGAAIGIMLDNG